ncbi:hypothetical protein V7138_06280 [Bacillus sp. JJ1533]|uniref:hypothetical protein n=1 Tax=Bacillus sp. JJ1533 TaxID=3122959 RepID=UPI002FFF7181
MKNENKNDRPLVLSHQPIRFETAKSWNPASEIGNIPHNKKEPEGGHPVGPENPGNGGIPPGRGPGGPPGKN